MAYLLLLQVDANRVCLGEVLGSVDYCDLTVLINLIYLLRDLSLLRTYNILDFNTRYENVIV